MRIFTNVKLPFFVLCSFVCFRILVLLASLENSASNIQLGIQQMISNKSGILAPALFQRNKTHASHTEVPFSSSEEFRDWNGTCSREVWMSGNHQKVISYSFLNKNPKYWRGINQILSTIPIRYPGWQMRIYAPNQDILFLKSKINVSNTDFLFFCDIHQLHPSVIATANCPVTFWRFAPMGDQLVDVMLSRDLDSEILEREIDAVTEWLDNTNKTLHSMRDHPFHGWPMLGGMWGLHMNENNRPKIRDLRDKMFKNCSGIKSSLVDQPMLEKFVWPAFKDDFIAHDSYLCQSYEGSSPWPTQRKERKFVGAQFFNPNSTPGSFVKNKCPVSCRPKSHSDWEYC